MTRPTVGGHSARIAAVVLAICLLLSRLFQAPTQEQEPTGLKVLMTDDWGNRPAFLAAVKDFEESHQDVRVDIERLPIRNMAEAVRGQVADGDPFGPGPVARLRRRRPGACGAG